MTYGNLNLIFLLVAVVATWILKSRFRCFTTPQVILPMVLLTAIFDNLIVLAGIVKYDRSKLMEVFVGVVPIEDFAYTVVAVLLIPALWRFFRK